MQLSQPPSPRPSQVGPRPSQGAPSSSLRTFVFTYLPFVLSAMWTALVIRLVLRDIRYAIPVVVVAALWVIPLYIQHQRQRAMLLRGNVPDVLEAWTPMLEQTPHPETVQPILMATAYAANGWTDAAREALGRAQRGPAWDAAAEQRLVIGALLDAFDGDRTRAVRSAAELAAMPLPNAGMFMNRRINTLRTGLAALTRAFARAPQAGDAELLRAAAKSSPLFFWAFRYAASILAIEDGNPKEARKLLDGAPQWSQSSVFAQFHDELGREIARLEAIKSA